LNLKGLRAPIDNSGGSPYSRSARYARPGCSKDSLWLWIQAIAAVAVRPARDAPITARCHRSCPCQLRTVRLTLKLAA
jgi:hypothetical protein